MKDRTSVENLDEHKSIGVHRTALYVNCISMTYFDSFGVEHISEKIKRFISNKNIITNIFKIQTYDLIMCEYFCIRFKDFVVKGKILADFTNLFSPHNFEKIEKVVLDFFFFFIWVFLHDNSRITGLQGKGTFL